jgi:hypothetical protein
MDIFEGQFVNTVNQFSKNYMTIHIIILKF